jgi:hypothetical protein
VYRRQAQRRSAAAAFPALEAIPFADRVQDAQEAGLISAEEGAQWLNALAQAGEAGHFFQAITHFIVGGRKPQP